VAKKEVEVSDDDSYDNGRYGGDGNGGDEGDGGDGGEAEG
jgi:hypothetical protein